MKTLDSMLRLVSTLGASGCTTTVQQASGGRPVLNNAAPSQMSELRIAESALTSGNMEMATTLYNKILQ